MNKILRIFTGTLICTIFIASCSEEDMKVSAPDKANLQLDLCIEQNVSTRKTETYFEEGEEVAILLLTPGGSLYHTATGYEKYTYIDRRWESINPTILEMDEVRVYAAYPWSTALNYTQHRHQVPIESASQTDYMVGKQANGSFINAQNPKTRVNMTHAMAKIRFSITKGTYIGAGKVTSASFTNTEGSLLGTGYKTDLITGNVITTGAAVDRNAHNISTWGTDGIVLSSVAHGPDKTDYLMIPGNGKIKISLTIDGVAYSVIYSFDGSTSGNGHPRTLTAGSVYTINLRMSGSSLNIISDNIILNNWYNAGTIDTH